MSLETNETNLERWVQNGGRPNGWKAIGISYYIVLASSPSSSENVFDSIEPKLCQPHWTNFENKVDFHIVENYISLTNWLTQFDSFSIFFFCFTLNLTLFFIPLNKSQWEKERDGEEGVKTNNCNYFHPTGRNDNLNWRTWQYRLRQ